MTNHGPGTDRRPWLIISKKEAEALLKMARQHLTGTKLLDDPTLVRACSVIDHQLRYIKGDSDTGERPDIITTLIREQRS